MTHEATFSGSSPSDSETVASRQRPDSKPSSPAPSHGHANGANDANDAFLLTLRPLLNLYDSPTSPAWGFRK